MFTGDQHIRAEEAINFYQSVFHNTTLIQMERYEEGTGPEAAIVHSRFTLEGQEFIAMDSHVNLGYNFNPAISFVVNCETQADIDYYWDKLTEGGDERAQQCGWLQDKFGVSWQIIPADWDRVMHDPEKSERAMNAVLKMKKIDIQTIQRAIEQF
jgi:predicted 3-demethylubiquinone-9 3-methyltransferase (glyoxalase superfamily)